MNVCTVVEGVQRALCSRTPWWSSSSPTPTSSSLRRDDCEDSAIPLTESIDATARAGHLYDDHGFDDSFRSSGSGSSWKFWRRLSFISRGHVGPRSKANKDRVEVGPLSKTDIGEPLYTDDASAPLHGNQSLPDVVERAHALPVFNANAVPPPKPPRLFLSRTSSKDGSKSSSIDSVSEEKDDDDAVMYMNCRQLQNQLHSQLDSKTSETGENNNVIGKLSLTHVQEEEPDNEDDSQILKRKDFEESHEFSKYILSKCSIFPIDINDDSQNTKVIDTNANPMASVKACSTLQQPTITITTATTTKSLPPTPAPEPPSSPPPPLLSSSGLTTSTTSAPNSITSTSPYSQYQSSTSSTNRKAKIVTPELSHKRYGRSRRKMSNSDKSGGTLVARQRNIMSSILDLMCQRLDPYPLLDPLKRAGVLTNVHLQSFLGHCDRKSVCEGLADVIGNGSPEHLSVLCAVMSSFPRNCTEILEILQVMREIDRIVYDIPQQKSGNDNEETNDNNNADVLVKDSEESSVLSGVVEDKNLNFDVGYLTPDYSLKPLMELDRVRSNNINVDYGTTGRRHSKSISTRTSSYSLLEEGVGSAATLAIPRCGNGITGGSSTNDSSDLATFPGLVMMSISITGHSLAGERSDVLADVIHSHNCISELRLGKTQLTDQDVTRLTSALAEKSSTVSFDIRLNAISAVGAEAVSTLLTQTRYLRVLNISSTELDTESFLGIVSAISGNKSLVEFDGSFLDMTDECCSGLRDMLRANTTLQKLRLRGNNLTHEGCQRLCEGLVKNIGLSALDLSRNPIGNAGVKALAQFLPQSFVTDVCIDGCSITPQGGQALSELISDCKRLKHLDVSTNEIADGGIGKMAAALERTSNLEAVSMNMCAITNIGFSKLLDVLEKNTSILGLKLCYNKLGGENTENPAIGSENLRYRLKIVMSSKPKLKILLWGNDFDNSS